jgi:hypothetical protein
VYSLDELPDDFYEQHEIVSGVTKLAITYTEDGPIFEYDGGTEVDNDPTAPSTNTSIHSTPPSIQPTSPENPSTHPSLSSVPTVVESPTPTRVESPTPTRESDASFTFTDQGIPSASPTETMFPVNETSNDDLALDDNFTLFPSDDFANETDDAFDFNSTSINDMSTNDQRDYIYFSRFPTHFPITDSDSEESYSPDSTLPWHERGIDGMVVSGEGRYDDMDKFLEDTADATQPSTEHGVFV